VRRLIRRAARRYIAGTTLAEAVAAAGSRPVTLGYWDSGKEKPADVAREYAHALAATQGLDAYVSVKATALEFDPALLESLGAPVHLDSLGIDTVDATFSLAERVPVLGVTLPGRWRRSVDDAARAAEWGVRARVVKGQFASGDDVNPSSGFLAVLERLATLGVERIAVATHDATLATEALRRVPHAELEQLYGIRPVAPTHRVYVPYGTAYLPYALRYLRRKPSAAWWLVRDLLRSVRYPPP
jgi:proline dehydrogenase